MTNDETRVARMPEPAPADRGPSRRTLIVGGAGALAAIGMAGRLAGVAGQASSPAATTSGTPAACVLTTEMTEGPYYLPLELVRKDITEGTPGLPLRLRIAVQDMASCAPLKGAAVDIWHCDAQGFYSGVTGENPGGNGSQTAPDVSTATFLRGIQLTGDDGVAEFDTIYPGWYMGRAVHIHMKVHVGGAAEAAAAPATAVAQTYSGGHVAHTGQLFFDDAISDQVYDTDKAYAGRDNSQRLRNGQDNILGNHASEPGVMLTLTPASGGAATGYVGTVTVGVDSSATPSAASGGGPGSDGRPGGPPPGGNGTGTPGG